VRYAYPMNPIPVGLRKDKNSRAMEYDRIHWQTHRWKKAIKLTAWRRDGKTMPRREERPSGCDYEMTSRQWRGSSFADVRVPSVIVLKSDGRASEPTVSELTERID